MKTHNRIIFHCLTCGNVLHAECDQRPPHCCGYEMVRAAAETICDDEGSAAEEIDNREAVATMRTTPC